MLWSGRFRGERPRYLDNIMIHRLIPEGGQDAVIEAVLNRLCGRKYMITALLTRGMSPVIWKR